MNAHVSAILLGVNDMEKSKRFYTEGLGWKIQNDYKISVFFVPHGGSLVGFYGREGLAADVGVNPQGSGFPGVVMNYVVRSEKRVDERKSAATKEEDASALLAKIAEMADADRAMAKRVHAIVKASAPDLSPKLWYGMPAYYKDGKVVCFFQDAQKFKSRYATFGFSDAANLDEGGLWPVAFALKELTAAAEARIGALVKKAVSWIGRASC